MSNNSDAQAIIDNAIVAAGPKAIDPNEISVVTSPAGSTQVMWDGEKYLDHPRRKRGHARMFTAQSLATYVNTHKGPGTEIYADVEKNEIVAILNGDIPANDEFPDPGWRDHRATFSARLTKEWQDWTHADCVAMGQVSFAEFIEAHSRDIQSPDAATMLEVAKNFEANVSVDFKTGARLDNGDRRLIYTETTEAKVGTTGTIDVPEQIELGLVPFEGAAAYKVSARLRFRINGGDLKLTIVLDRPDLVLRDAFDGVVGQVADLTETIVYLGQAPGARYSDINDREM